MDIELLGHVKYRKREHFNVRAIFTHSINFMGPFLLTCDNVLQSTQ